MGFWKRPFLPKTPLSFPSANAVLLNQQKATEAFLAKLCLREVMLPRSSIVFVDQRAALEDIYGLFQSSQATALPVFQEKLDTVVGVLSIHDCLRALKDGASAWTPYMRPAFFAAASMSVLEGVLEMYKRHVPFILVVDEYGGVDGWVCLETILESLLDHLQPLDSDSEISPPQSHEDGGTLLDARLPLDDLKNFLGEQAPPWTEEMAEGIETVGGWVCHLVGRVPFKGEVIQDASGMRFEVLEADPRKVKQVILYTPPPSLSQEERGSRAV
jgi:CBS domain containing-hemolysin-like protein